MGKERSKEMIPVREEVMSQKEMDSLIFQYPGPVDQIAFSPDGTLGAIGHGEVSLRKIGSNKNTIMIPLGVPNCLAFSPNGQYLAVGRGPSFRCKDPNDGCVDLWDLTSMRHISLRRVAPVNKETGLLNVAAITFSPDSKRIAVGSGEGHGMVEIWDIPTRSIIQNLDEGELSRSITGGGDHIKTVVFTSNGEELAVGGLAGFISIWSSNTGEIISTIIPEEDRIIKMLTYHPDNRYLICATNVFVPIEERQGDSQRGEIQIWDVQTKGLVRSIAHEDNRRVQGLAASPNGKYLVVGGDGRDINIWDLDLGEKIKNFSDHPHPLVRSVALNSDAEYIAAAGGQQVKIWSMGECENGNR